MFVIFLTILLYNCNRIIFAGQSPEDMFQNKSKITFSFCVHHTCCYHRTPGMSQNPATSHHCAESSGRTASCPTQPPVRSACSCGSHPAEHLPQRMQDTERKMPRMPQTHMSCNASRQSDCRERKFPIAMAYVPWQKFRDIYNPEKAFCQGTIFAELDLPFCGCRKGGFR